MGPILQCQEVSKYFGAFAALKGITFVVNTGEIFGVAGPNGAGKSTLFNVITANPFTATSGRVVFQDEEIQGLKPHEICHKGIARTFQTPEVFGSLTYLQNVQIGTIFGKSGGRAVFRSPSGLVDDSRERAMQALRTVGLIEKANIMGKVASLFDMKRLMLASALATGPKAILLDEPMGGLNRTEIDQTIRLVREINKQGITVLIIEHVMTALMALSGRVMILDYGETISKGTPAEVGRDKAVIEVYLGEEYRAPEGAGSIA